MSSPPLALSLDAVDPAVLFFGPFVVLAMGYFIWLHRRKRGIAARMAEAERVAREVAATNPAFEPERLLADAGVLLHEVMRAWGEKDVKALRAVTDPYLGEEWAARLRKSGRRYARQWYRLRDVQYAGLVNAEDDEEDWVVVRFVSDHAGLPPHHASLPVLGATTHGDGKGGWRLAEYWSLVKRGDGWIVFAVERERVRGRGSDYPIVAHAEAVGPTADARMR